VQPDIEKAKELLLRHSYSCVVCSKGNIVTSSLRGVQFLLQLYRQNRNLTAYSIADKVIGKATAMLIVALGIEQAHGVVMSKAATAVLSKYQVKYSFDSLVPMITNRMGTGLCPMEQAVLDTNNPIDAATVLEKAIQHMMFTKSERQGEENITTCSLLQ